MNENYPTQEPENRDQHEEQPPIRVQTQQVAVKLPPLNAWVSYSIMGVTILVYVLQMVSGFTAGSDIPAALGAKINENIARGEFWRLFTPMLLHGSILHIAFNMYALMLFGPRLERHFGHGRFFILYVLSGFAGNVISMMFTPAPSLGSSTAIFGLIGAQGVFIFQNRGIFGNRSRQALTSIISVAAINLFIGLSPGIDNWGHIGGLIGGTLFAWFAGPLLRVDGIYPSFRLIDQRETAEIIQAMVVIGAFFVILAIGTLYIWSI